MPWGEDFSIIAIFVMSGKEESSFVLDYPTEMIPTLSQLLVITKPVLVNIAPKIIIKMIANRVEQLAVVIIRQIDEIRN